MCVVARLLHVVRKNILSGDVSSALVFDDRMGHYVGPSNEIVDRLLHGHDNRMRHDIIGEINPSCIFDEGKARLAAARVSSHSDVRFKIRDTSLGTVVRLLSHSNEEQVHCVYEPLGATGAASLPKAAKVPNVRRKTVRRRVYDRID